jgi:hypothetical protein
MDTSSYSLAELLSLNCSVSLLLVKVKEFTCLSLKAICFISMKLVTCFGKKGTTLNYAEMDSFNVRCTYYNI